MTGWIAISLGDVTGIGPEVTLKALATEIRTDDTRYLLIGDAECVRRLDRQLGLKLPLQVDDGQNPSGRIFLCQPHAQQLPGCGMGRNVVCVTKSKRW
jgi:4-hydroxythreonine-4-phosphate dehydrogenase